MSTQIFKSSVAQQIAVAANTWVKVTFNERRNVGLGADAQGYYDEYVNLVPSNGVIRIEGDYGFVGNVRCTESRINRKYWARAILERTTTGNGLLTYEGGGIAKYSDINLGRYANVGNPLNTLDPWYLTNILTMTGANDPLYNVTGNIVDFDTANGSWIKYDGIAGTPTSPDTSTSKTATIQVGLGFSTKKQGHTNVFSTNEYDACPISRELYALLVNDKIWLEYWHEETNPINLIWGLDDCFMNFKRHR